MSISIVVTGRATRPGRAPLAACAPVRTSTQVVVSVVLAVTLMNACSTHRSALNVSSKPSVAATVSVSAGGLDGRTLAVYRTVADSVYVRSTQRTVAVLTTPLDTACASPVVGSLLAGLPCESLADRWAIGSVEWTGVDSEEMASTRASWVANSGRSFDLRPIPAGWPNLVAVDPADAPSSTSDLQDWALFRDTNGYAVGAVRFSPVGFGRSGKTALVAVEWRCGPTCGHTLTAALVATGDSTWRIDNMVLLSSLQH